MGLDGVEIILGIEEAFGINIPDNDAMKLETVGDIHVYVIGRLQGRRSNRCLSSIAFYDTRRALVDITGQPRRTIAPATAMDSLLPMETRPAQWDALRSRLGRRIPSLARPYHINIIIAGASILLLSLSLLLFAFHHLEAGRATLALAFIIVPTMRRITAPLAREIPAGYTTVGDTSRGVLRWSYHKYAGPENEWNEQEVWDVIKGIVVEVLEVEPEKVTPEARLVADLGVG